MSNKRLARRAEETGKQPRGQRIRITDDVEFVLGVAFTLKLVEELNIGLRVGIQGSLLNSVWRTKAKQSLFDSDVSLEEIVLLQVLRLPLTLCFSASGRR